MKKINVISEVVKHQLCIGCGVCAAVCPSGNLKMNWNEYGEYNPFEQGVCLENCSLCLGVCPFMRGNDNEDILSEKLFGSLPNIKHRTETGFFLNTFVGYSCNRSIAASGGVTTFLLEKLLQSGSVDKIVCVKPSDSGNALYEYRVMGTKEEIRQSAGSAYYPVTLSDVVKYIMENPGNYALTALPCFAKALRLSAEKIPVLKKRIKFILGLVCGQLKSSFYTKYIAFLAGVTEPLKRCFFREKAVDQPANNYAFFCEGVSGKTARKRFHDGVGDVWVSRWFTPLVCNYCDDIFAETADVVLMDAWLSLYRTNPAGTSLVLVRHPEILSIIEDAEKNELNLEPIPIGDLIRSQAGVIRIKRRQLSYRLSKETGTHKNIPSKRVAPCSLPWSFFEKREIDILEKMQMISRESVPEAQRNGITYEDIGLRLEPYTRKLRKIRRMKAFVNLPARVIRKIGRIIKRG